jgi:NADPH:quinone reductase-like Zn-dependent oxidoreductase
MVTDTMIAVWEDYGSPVGLQLKEIPKPIPKANQVLIRIQATRVRAMDVLLRQMTGLTRFVIGLFFGMGKIKILGHEFTGEI